MKKKQIAPLLCMILFCTAAAVGDSIQTDTTLDLESGIFASVHYDTRRSILTLTFQNGLIYQYSQVSRKTYETFLRTSYKGSFFHAHIRNGYTWKRMDKNQVAATWPQAK